MTPDTPPPDDDLEDDDLEDDDLELEPIDPEIVAHQRRRGVQQTRAAEDAVDINAAYEEADTGDPIDLKDFENFRFTTRHLLVLTAVLAIAMTLFLQLGRCLGLFVSGGIALAAGWWFVLREQRRKLAAVDARREQMAVRIARERAIEDGEPVEPLPTEEFDQVNNTWDAAKAERPAIDLSFSTKQMFAAFAVAALLLGITRWVGGEHAALLLGLVALVGLAMQATGYDPPPIVILGWWLLLVLYLLIGLWAAFGEEGQVATLRGPAGQMPAIYQIAAIGCCCSGVLRSRV